MSAATRQGDNCTGHDSCPAVPLVECSSDVIINGRGAGRQGDHYTPHGCIVAGLYLSMGDQRHV